MKLVMHKEEGLREDRVEIFYKEMNGEIQAITACVQQDRMHLPGVLDGDKYSLDIHEIYYFDSVDKMSFAYLKEAVYKVPYTLGEIETQLMKHGFVRISKAVVVNIYKIDHMSSELNMRIKAHLENGEALLVSRHYKKGFEEALKKVRKQIMGEDK